MSEKRREEMRMEFKPWLETKIGPATIAAIAILYITIVPTIYHFAYGTTGITDWTIADELAPVIVPWPEAGPEGVFSPLYNPTYWGTVLIAIIAVGIWAYWHIWSEIEEARAEKEAVEEWLAGRLPYPASVYIDQIIAERAKEVVKAEKKG